jgi:hypothetical protein
MGSCVSWLAFPSDATSCATFIGAGGAGGAPLRSHRRAHAGTDTIDLSRSRTEAVQTFEYVTSTSMMRFLVLLQAEVSLFILRVWSYVGCLRYIVETDKLSVDPSGAVSVFAVALVCEGLLLAFVLLFILGQNGAFAGLKPLVKLLCPCGRKRCCRLCCDRDGRCYQCLMTTFCIESDEAGEHRRHQPVHATGAAPGSYNDVIVSSSDGDDSSDVEAEERPPAATTFTALRWRYALTRPVAHGLMFGTLDNDTVSRAQRQTEEATFDQRDAYFLQHPTDCEGEHLTNEQQLTAARYARRGMLPPDPHATLSDRAEDESRWFMLLILVLWAPNAVMMGVDWFLYSRDPQNPAYNVFFWISFLLGFVTALGPPWYYWQHWMGWVLEKKARDDGTSVYSHRYKYDMEWVRHQQLLAQAALAQSMAFASLRPSSRATLASGAAPRRPNWPPQSESVPERPPPAGT